MTIQGNSINNSSIVNATRSNAVATSMSNTTADGAAFEAELNKAKAEMDALQKSATSAQESGDLEALKKVAKDFEEIFINMLLKSMRSTIEDGGLTEKSNQRGIFEGMLDEEFTKKMVSAGGIGIQDMMVKQLSRYVEPTIEEDKAAKPSFDSKG